MEPKCCLSRVNISDLLCDADEALGSVDVGKLGHVRLTWRPAVGVSRQLAAAARLRQELRSRFLQSDALIRPPLEPRRSARSKPTAAL